MWQEKHLKQLGTKGFILCKILDSEGVNGTAANHVTVPAFKKFFFPIFMHFRSLFWY